MSGPRQAPRVAVVVPERLRVEPIDTGRRAVLVELDPKYAHVAVERVRRAEEIVAMGESA